MLGADFGRGRWHSGMVFTHSEGDGEYRGQDGELEVSSRVKGLYPHVSYAASQTVVDVGCARSRDGGSGAEVGANGKRDDSGAPIETAIGDLGMGAAGARGALLLPGRSPAG